MPLIPASRPSPSVTRALALTLLATTAALALPAAASAKTFVARIGDKSGDARTGSTDIVTARVAYNRKSGAISINVKMKDDIDAANDDAIVSVLFSDLRNGKCQKATLAATVVLSVPGVAVAHTLKNGGQQLGKTREGTSTIEGDELSMRIKHSKLAGRTPGCTYVSTMTNDKGTALLDETEGDDGFVTS